MKYLSHRLPCRLAAVLLVFCTLPGCTSGPGNQVAAAPICNSLNCIREQTRRSLYKQCSRDLFFYDSRSRGQQKAIRNEYQYPLTSTDQYFSWVGMGYSAVSPDEWCRSYAKAKI